MDAIAPIFDAIARIFATPFGTIVALLLIEGLVLFMSDWRLTRTLLKYVPSMFWIYFLPMLAATAGLLPPEKAGDQTVTPAYGLIARYCLPASLILLLLAVDLRAIWRLGRIALLVMLAGSLGIIVGGPLVLMLYGPWLPEGMWSGVGALSASWVGGSANMMTVAEGLGTPKPILSLMIIIDTICPYTWMFLLIVLAPYQGFFDRLLRARPEVTRDLARHAAAGEVSPRPLTLRHLGIMLAVAAGGALVCIEAGQVLPGIEYLLTPKLDFCHF